MNSSSDGFKELEFALTLGARENLIYYPYSLITRDSDRLNCWATLTDPVKFQVEITRLKKKVKLTWETAALKKSRSLNSVSWGTGSIRRVSILRTNWSTGVVWFRD